MNLINVIIRVEVEHATIEAVVTKFQDALELLDKMYVDATSMLYLVCCDMTSGQGVFRLALKDGYYKGLELVSLNELNEVPINLEAFGTVPTKRGWKPAEVLVSASAPVFDASGAYTNPFTVEITDGHQYEELGIGDKLKAELEAAGVKFVGLWVKGHNPETEHYRANPHAAFNEGMENMFKPYMKATGSEAKVSLPKEKDTK